MVPGRQYITSQAFMKRSHELSRDRLLAKSFLEQRISEALYDEGHYDAAEIVHRMHIETEDELDSLLEGQLSLTDRFKAVGAKMLKGFGLS